jgi:tetratricopeptide (TPR) repeat protein
MLAWTHYFDGRFGWTKTPSDSMKLAVQLVKKAQAIDDTLSGYHSFWGTIYILQGQHEKAIAEGQKAIDRDPNNAWTMYILHKFCFLLENIMMQFLLPSKLRDSALTLRPGTGGYWE